jgi:hypothetical protein
MKGHDIKTEYKISFCPNKIDANANERPLKTTLSKMFLLRGGPDNRSKGGRKSYNLILLIKQTSGSDPVCLWCD